MNSIVENYFKAQQELFEYVGYDGPTWIGISDDTASYWYIGPNDHSVCMAPHKEELIEGLPSCCIEYVYKAIGLDSAICRGAEHTLICLTDSGDTYLRLFDNSKQLDYSDCKLD